MPFWRRETPEEAQRRLQAQQEAEASRREIEAGRLPLKARQRLTEEMQSGHPLFTSDLTSKEIFLTHSQGYQPLSQVMGSSIYHVGWQYTRRYGYSPSADENRTLSQAHQHAAQLALGRLEQEASLLHAHGVIGVRFARRYHEWGSNLLEYTAIGTAIKLSDAPVRAKPFLSDLSGQEFWTLLQAGYYPAGVVTGYCSYYVALGSQMTRQLSGFWGAGGYNQEVQPFTQGLYTARHLAMSRVDTMARNLKAVGIVGMHIENDRHIYEYETDKPSARYLDLYINFAVIGTAITTHKKDHTIPSPKPVLTLTDLRPGRYGQNRELTIRNE